MAMDQTTGLRRRPRGGGAPPPSSISDTNERKRQLSTVSLPRAVKVALVAFLGTFALSALFFERHSRVDGSSSHAHAYSAGFLSALSVLTIVDVLALPASHTAPRMCSSAVSLLCALSHTLVALDASPALLSGSGGIIYVARFASLAALVPVVYEMVAVALALVEPNGRKGAAALGLSVPQEAALMLVVPCAMLYSVTCIRIAVLRVALVGMCGVVVLLPVVRALLVCHRSLVAKHGSGLATIHTRAVQDNLEVAHILLAAALAAQMAASCISVCVSATVAGSILLPERVEFTISALLDPTGALLCELSVRMLLHAVSQASATMAQQRATGVPPPVAEEVESSPAVAEHRVTEEGGENRSLTKEEAALKLELERLKTEKEDEARDIKQQLDQLRGEPAQIFCFGGQRYRMQRRIGRGSTSVCFAVARENDGMLFALKQVQPDDSKAHEIGCLKEAELLRKMTHPSIIRIYDHHFCDNGQLVNILMELAGGGTLAQRICMAAESGAYFLESQILIWTAELASALQHVHEHRVLHRDLTTKNVFLTDTLRIKLGDFGISKQLTSTTFCATTLVGTPNYLSPEIWQGLAYNYKTDVWGLGCLLFETCALCKAFPQNDLASMMNSITSAEYAPFPSHYSPKLTNLVHEMLRPEPNERASLEAIVGSDFLQHFILRLERRASYEKLVLGQQLHG